MSTVGRLVVCAGGHEPAWRELPASVLDPARHYIGGGERSLYELAVGAAALGVDVELRGDINEPILRELGSAAGVVPRTGLPPRRPALGETVVLSEGSNPARVATVALSGARPILLLLAPPGLFGWSFLSGWPGPHDLTATSPQAVGWPEMFRAIAAMGFTMWSNAHGLVAAGTRAGVTVTWLGTGTPIAFPAAQTKTHDLAIVEYNRWRPAAGAIADRIPGASVLRIAARPSSYSLSEALGPARLLVWPSRLEGMSRIAREARGAGTVPVSLDTNPFITVQDHGDGVVLCQDEDDIEDAIARLLDDPPAIEKLAAEAVAGAREQAAWKPFLSRLEQLLRQLPEDPAGQARETIGDLAHLHEQAIRAEAEAASAEQRGALDAYRRRLVVRAADRLAETPAWPLLQRAVSRMGPSTRSSR